MTEPGRQLRRYGEKEVGRILERAAELQREEPESSNPRSGLTLRELQEIAAEAGIDPRHLQKAASELDVDASPAAGLAKTWLGAPVRVDLERVLDGELELDDFERLVPILQMADTGHGQAGQIGRTLTWKSGSSDNTRSLQVSISTRDGQTFIRAEERLGGMAGALFGGIVGGGGMGVGIGVGAGVGGAIGSALFAAAFPVAILASAYVGTRAIFSAVVRKRQRALTVLVDQLAAEVESCVTGRLESDEAPRELPRG